MWALDLLAMSDPAVRTSRAVEAAATGCVIVVLVLAPLMAGALAGGTCGSLRAAP